MRVELPLVVGELGAAAEAVAAAVATAVERPPAQLAHVEATALELLLRARARFQAGFGDTEATLELLGARAPAGPGRPADQRVARDLQRTRGVLLRAPRAPRRGALARAPPRSRAHPSTPRRSSRPGT